MRSPLLDSAAISGGFEAYATRLAIACRVTSSTDMRPLGVGFVAGAAISSSLPSSIISSAAGNPPKAGTARDFIWFLPNALI